MAALCTLLVVFLAVQAASSLPLIQANDDRPMIIQGDIRLTPNQANLLLSKVSGTEGQALVENGWLKLWDRNMPISYHMSGFSMSTSISAAIERSYLDGTAQNIIRKAFQYWQDHTCLNFEQDGQTRPIIQVQPDLKTKLCNSNVGTNGRSEQFINLGEGCFNYGTVTHEIGHALGFFHEHVRVDRDFYVHINKDNVPAAFYTDNYKLLGSEDNNNWNFPYDYGSIMQYPRYTTSPLALNPNVAVMTPTPGNELYRETMGQIINPSFLDLKMMNRLYRCADKCPPMSTQPRATMEAFPIRKTAKSASALGASARPTATTLTLDKTGLPPAQTGRVKIEIEQLRSMSFRNGVRYLYNRGCQINNVEFKMFNDVQRTGYRFCTEHDFSEGPGRSLTSEGNMAVISAYARGVQYMRIKFRAE
ncbi:hypothetical protein L596_026888 [Steinernema carpocapsae]|uniref:Metalloendopeptidase n=1 Tax=Steinernema carpocapsae TaxID=34508 RepID=A0A4U5M2P1_STECR|nr:hypothetical protein L596_026888 [Steinernema carpocapsae]